MSVLGSLKDKGLGSLPFGGKKEESKLSREQVLASRPVRNPDLEWELDDGRVLLHIPRDDHWYVKMMSFLFNISGMHKVKLDFIGTHVWQALDGERTVEAIAEELSREHSLGYKETELSLLEFLKDLAKREYIGVLIEHTPAAQPAGQTDAGGEAPEVDASPAAEPAAAEKAAAGTDGATPADAEGDGDDEEAQVGAITRAILERTDVDVQEVKEEK